LVYLLFILKRYEIVHLIFISLDCQVRFASLDYIRTSSLTIQMAGKDREIEILLILKLMFGC